MRPAICVFLILSLPLTVPAQVFRWVDDKGKVHYGDRPVANEVKRVPLLYEPKAKESLPALGMKASDVRSAYGEPSRSQKIVGKQGETLIWTYSRSKMVGTDFVVKLENGEVSEVTTDSAMATANHTTMSGGMSSTASQTKAVEISAALAADARAGEAEMQAAAARAGKCDQLRRQVDRISQSERRGSSASGMDSLREQKRQIEGEMFSLRC